MDWWIRSDRRSGVPGRRTAVVALIGLLLLTAAVASAQNVRFAHNPFAKGRWLTNATLGWGSGFGTDYVILGVGGTYFAVDGLGLSLQGEGWFGGDPGIWKLSPQVNYVFHQPERLKPYVGVLYRWTWIDEPYQDYQSYGGRAGLYYRGGGRTWVGVGVVHERYIDSDGKGLGDDSTTYPELLFAVGF
jgi:hypothetical protein